jgi:hypothetical protein
MILYVIMTQIYWGIRHISLYILFAEQLIMSSDKLSSHRQSILLLKLSTSMEDGLLKESLLEFDYSEIDDFLVRLVDARKVAKTIDESCYHLEVTDRV